MNIENPLFIYLHVPRTGGTTLLWSIGNHLQRENNRYLKHYHWMNTQQYLFNNIPLLERRTVEQQKELLFLTGHGTYAMAHYWLKVRKTPLLFATFRDPIDRLLSSFNFRHGISQLVQDRGYFATMDPPMDPHARFNEKSTSDYSTLYDWYQDASAEHNLQCKWMIKSVYAYMDDNFIPWENIVKTNNPNINPDIWPEWFENIPVDADMFQTVKNIVKDKLWWAGTSETLTDDIVDFCEFVKVPLINVDNRHRSGIDFPMHWTREEVEKQPDYHKLVEAETWDIQIYNYVKNICKRPF